MYKGPGIHAYDVRNFVFSFVLDLLLVHLSGPFFISFVDDLVLILTLVDVSRMYR
jgi:hypothetical protein